MSRFSGAQGKGAMREYRRAKRLEAETRQQKAILNVHPDGKCDCKRGARLHTVFPTAAAQDK